MKKQPIKQISARVIENREIAPQVMHLTLVLDEAFTFIPGQFVSFVFDKDGRKIRRPYSIVSTPDKKTISFCIKILEKGVLTPTIAKLKKDETITLLGPIGEFIINERSLNHDLVFISHGVGIAPLKSMIEHLLYSGFKKKITLLTGYKNKTLMLYHDEFILLTEKYPTFFYKTITSEDGDGRVQTLVVKSIDQMSHYYLCGLKDMISQTKHLLQKNGVPMSSIFSERFD